MNERMHRRVTRFYVLATALAFVLFIVLAAAEAYVRWTHNQTFTFLGDNGLIGIALLCGAQFLGLARILRGASKE